MGWRTEQIDRAIIRYCRDNPTTCGNIALQAMISSKFRTWVNVNSVAGAVFKLGISRPGLKQGGARNSQATHVLLASSQGQDIASVRDASERGRRHQAPISDEARQVLIDRRHATRLAADAIRKAERLKREEEVRQAMALLPKEPTIVKAAPRPRPQPAGFQIGSPGPGIAGHKLNALDRVKAMQARAPVIETTLPSLAEPDTDRAVVVSERPVKGVSFMDNITERAFVRAPEVRPMASPRQCSWPIGHPGTIDFRTCDDPVHREPERGARPYCLAHCKVAYQGFRASVG